MNSDQINANAGSMFNKEPLDRVLSRLKPMDGYTALGHFEAILAPLMLKSVRAA